MAISLVLVYFVYGLCFLAMGLAVLLEAGREGATGQGQRLGWLAAFGLIHGSHEWLQAYLLQAQAAGTGLPAWLDWLQVALLFTSFSCLAAYAVVSFQQSLGSHRPRLWPYALLGLFEVSVLLGAVWAYRDEAVPWVRLLDAISRYGLAVPAGFLAAAALGTDAAALAADNRLSAAVNLRMAAVGFAVYAATQFLVHPLQFFPANIVNQDVFLSATGVPIQLIRAVAGALIAVGVLRAAQAAERQRQLQLQETHQAHLAVLQQRDALRRDLLRHVVRSQEDERARIARELHDDIAQLLSASSLELGALRTKLRRPDTTQMVDRLQDLSRQMSQGLYHLVRDLRPSQLDSLGLVPALRFLFSQDCAPKGLDVVLRIDGDQSPLDGLVETALYRVAQEGLANVIRHSGTNAANVELLYCCDHVSLRICDHGRGFDPAEEFNPPRGWGLAGMRERVESLGGRLNLHSSPGQGTTVEAVIPSRGNRGKEFVDGTDHIVARG